MGLAHSFPSISIHLGRTLSHKTLLCSVVDVYTKVLSLLRPDRVVYDVPALSALSPGLCVQTLGEYADGELCTRGFV